MVRAQAIGSATLRDASELFVSADCAAMRRVRLTQTSADTRRVQLLGEHGAGVLDDGGDLLGGELARRTPACRPRPLVTTAIWSAGSG